jgi:hypothetical protein
MSDLQTTQENQISIIYDKVNSCNNHELTNMTKSLNSPFEALSVQNAKLAIALNNLESARNAMKLLDTRLVLQENSKIQHQRILQSEKGQKLLAQANTYHIPYNENDIDWLALGDLVREYELLLKQAAEYNLDWDSKYYDPIGLEQLIEDYQCQLREERKELYQYYFSHCTGYPSL